MLVRAQGSGGEAESAPELRCLEASPCAALSIPGRRILPKVREVPAPATASPGRWTAAGVKERRVGALLGTAELKLLEMQREGKAMLKTWVLTVGSETKWSIRVDFDSKRDVLIFKVILVEMC